MLYDFIDNSDFYINPVDTSCRSIMNVPFVLENSMLEKKFISEASDNGFLKLKGHSLFVGMRAIRYNAMPLEGVKELIKFMDYFKSENG